MTTGALVSMADHFIELQLTRVSILSCNITDPSYFPL